MLAEVAAKAEQLRANGAARLALKTGAFGMPDLALAIRVASELDFELLTIDGSGGGTGMSPNDMLDNWGVPSVLLHAKAHDYAFLRAAAGKKVVDLAVGGGLAKPSQAFKALALGADAVLIARPFVTAVYGAGADGVAAYTAQLGNELADTMRLCGAPTLDAITRDMVRVIK